MQSTACLTCLAAPPTIVLVCGHAMCSSCADLLLPRHDNRCLVCLRDARFLRLDALAPGVGGRGLALGAGTLPPVSVGHVSGGRENMGRGWVGGCEIGSGGGVGEGLG